MTFINEYAFEYKKDSYKPLWTLAALQLSDPQYMFVTNSYLSFQDSFKKWCSSGVVSAISRCEIIDFTGFSGTFQDTAVTYK